MAATYKFKLWWIAPDGTHHETTFEKTIADAIEEWADLTGTRERPATLLLWERNHWTSFRSTAFNSIA